MPEPRTRCQQILVEHGSSISADKGPDINKGVWFQSRLSGLWYQNHKAAGEIAIVMIDGHRYSDIYFPSYEAEINRLNNLLHNIECDDDDIIWCRCDKAHTLAEIGWSCGVCGGQVEGIVMKVPAHD